MTEELHYAIKHANTGTERLLAQAFMDSYREAEYLKSCVPGPIQSYIAERDHYKQELTITKAKLSAVYKLMEAKDEEIKASRDEVAHFSDTIRRIWNVIGLSAASLDPGKYIWDYVANIQTKLESADAKIAEKDAALNKTIKFCESGLVEETDFELSDCVEKALSSDGSSHQSEKAAWDELLKSSQLMAEETCEDEPLTNELVMKRWHKAITAVEKIKAGRNK